MLLQCLVHPLRARNDQTGREVMDPGATLHVSLIIGCERLNSVVLALKDSRVTSNQVLGLLQVHLHGPQRLLGPAQQRFGWVDTR